MEVTKYDIVIQWALNNPLVVVLVLISTFLITLPQIMEGLKSIYNLFSSYLKEKPFVIEYADEVVTFEEKLISHNFDIIKINAITYKLGVRAEYEWLNKRYPIYKKNMQKLMYIETPQGMRIFDVLVIMKGNKKKEIYFDITDFFHEASMLGDNNINEYAKIKINDIYKNS